MWYLDQSRKPLFKQSPFIILSILLVVLTISYTLTILLIFLFLFSGQEKWELYVLHHQKVIWGSIQGPEGSPILSYMVFLMTGGSMAGTE